jgi:hypothetical protein
MAEPYLETVMLGLFAISCAEYVMPFKPSL